jgi:hypothetical protein
MEKQRIIKLLWTRDGIHIYQPVQAIVLEKES